MSLRLRLVAVFFLLSVVPLGALTFYTFIGNVAAMTDAAEQEARLLSDELSQRMETVTAQLTQRMSQLLDSSSSDAGPDGAISPAVAAAVPTAPGPSTGAADPAGVTAVAPATSAVADDNTADGGPRVTDALSELSMLVNNIEVRGAGRLTGTGRGARRGRGSAGRQGQDRGADGAPSFPAATLVTDRAGQLDRGRPSDRPAPDDSNMDSARIRIDLEPIRREILQTLVPDSRIDELSSDERQRVFAEANQRMRDIQQGIQIVRDKIAEQVIKAEADVTEINPTVIPAQPPAQTPVAATPAVASAVSPAQATTTQRKSALTGSRLDVREERDGEVVSQVTGDVNLPLLMNAVFSATRYDRSEVPFAVANDGRLYTLNDEDMRKIEALDAPAIDPAAPPATTVLPEWIVVTSADPTGSGLKFGIARPMGEALEGLRRTTLRNAGIGLGFIGLALVAIFPLSSRLTRDLSHLSEAVRRIALGDYTARVDVRSHDEIGRLGLAFNQMAADVGRHQRSLVEQERIRRELELGRQIQHDMLPQAPLTLGLMDIRGVSVPAREVGGDFFNYFQMTNGNVALLVGDVSGKGVGAALLMANIQASLRTRLSLGQDLASLAIELDRDIESSTPGPVYATLFVGIVDPATRELRCVNAGHNPQFVVRANGGLERLESTGRPIGLLPGLGYVEQKVQLEAGDLLFFYTDGCVEAENVAGEMFGLEQLEGLLRAAAGTSADQLLVRVEDAVSRFRAGCEPSDDATMMVVKAG